MTDNEDELCAVTWTFNGGPSGAKNQMRYNMVSGFY